MSDNKLPPDNRERPPDEHEWPWLWEAADKAQKAWTISGPIHAAITNWKPLAAIVSIIAAISAWSNPAVVALLKAFLEGPK